MADRTDTFSAEQKARVTYEGQRGETHENHLLW